MPPLSDALHELRDLLQREKESGQSLVAISAESIDQLRGLPEKLRNRPVTPPVADPAPSPTVQENPESAPVLEPAVKETLPNSPSAEPDPEFAARGIELLIPEGATSVERIDFLKNLAEKCEACRSLGTLRDEMVFSVGAPEAEIMFVGEAPGFEEEKQREPFVGPAGQKLTAIIKAMGLRRPEDIYISNIVKFRPKIGDGSYQGSKNRKPTPDEMAAAIKYVMAEIDVIRPKAIVALGGTAAEGLLDQSGSVGGMRNQFHELKGIPVMVTYHPSYLCRAESNSADGGRTEKRKVWEDMLLVMEKIGLSISEKQRGYFA